MSPEETRANFLDEKPGSPGFGLGSLERNDPRYVSVDDQTYNAGATYHATGGYYRFGIDTSNGSILGLDRLAPEKAAQERKPLVGKDGLPALQRYSDVVWLFWARQAASRDKLKYFFTVAITNEQTQRAIRRAFKNANKKYGPWPGATFGTDSDKGKVLLGSPNGRAHGYSLAQHKPQLGGNMYISKIQVFHGETEPFIPNIVLHVKQPKPATEKLGTTTKARERGLRKKSAKI
ncbi:uncharacterized protein EKO05_0008173 [Ascochyta rabiei]|uniref:uncharacterized protein n=1 Tax=Didymella rabiei TaxID=5454 RepID=UPI002209C1F5|nr:uncharacterized protein EKO05_0008173 [Ascochyta rabiei]UPX17846.1 hypothetical protein EKO05_0008173 [Ascochyta rabiei]